MSHTIFTIISWYIYVWNGIIELPWGCIDESKMCCMVESKLKGNTINYFILYKQILILDIPLYLALSIFIALQWGYAYCC